jgi:hypothetical protein
MKFRDLIKMLEENGWLHVRTNGIIGFIANLGKKESSSYPFIRSRTMSRRVCSLRQ